MKKSFYLAALLFAALTFTFVACEDKKNGGEESEIKGDHELTPEESKEKLVSVAQRFAGKFNTADQKAAIELADGLYEKYEDFSWETFEEQYADRFENMFSMPRYVKQVVQGRRVPTDYADIVHHFSFPEESAIFEADEVNRTWKYLGKADDNSVILRFKDKNGTQCEARAWGEGTVKMYSYAWDNMVVPKIYAEDGANLVYCAYYHVGNEWYNCYFEPAGTTAYWVCQIYNYTTGEYDTLYLEDWQVEDKYAYDPETYTHYYYEESTGRYYYNDYDNEHAEGQQIIEVELPSKINFTLKQGSKTVIGFSLAQELVKNDHANISVEALVSNLGWTTDIKIGSTKGSCAFAFKYGAEKLFSAAVNLPVYQLIDKADDQAWEDWAEQYADRYDELLSKIGSADAIMDIMGAVQVKGQLNNFGEAYRQFRTWNDKYEDESKASVDEFCNIINKNQTHGIYYDGTDIKQAEVRLQTAADEYGYYPEAVIYFPADGTTYAIEQYFQSKVFTDLQYTAQDLANSYIRLSKLLFEEVGEIHFAD